MHVQKRRRWCGLAAVSWAAALALLPLGLTAHDRLQLFDGYIHYSVGSPEQYPPEQAIAILDEAGIGRALLSSTPNEGTILLHKLFPERFIPELRPYRTTRDFERRKTTLTTEDAEDAEEKTKTRKNKLELQAG